MDGLLLINKPEGKTSHDIVHFVRKTYGFKKVGHCGTLDPLATGLLMLVIGKATKVQDLLMSEDKEYQGTLKLGETTSSQDAQGDLMESRPVPELSDVQIKETFDKFKGDFYQTPPMVSAIKQNGVPLYKLARQGKEVERKPRFVHVYSYQILETKLPEISFIVNCTKGFYVRTYCHEIGQTIGCGAHLSQLTRLKSGNFKLENALSWEQISENPDKLLIEKSIIPLPEISRIRRL